MADNVTRQEFADYMTALEGRLDGRFEQIDHRFEQIDHRFDRIDRRFEQNEVRVDQHEGRLARVEQRVDDLHSSMNVQFEELRGSFKFFLEALTALGEKTERGFVELRAQMTSEFSSLRTAVVDLQVRVGRLERPSRARKRSRS